MRDIKTPNCSCIDYAMRRTTPMPAQSAKRHAITTNQSDAPEVLPVMSTSAQKDSPPYQECVTGSVAAADKSSRVESAEEHHSVSTLPPSTFEEVVGDTVAERSLHMLHSEMYSDLELQMKSHSFGPKSIRVHRCMMARASTVWSTAVRWAANNSLIIEYFSYEVIYAIVQFIYTGTYAITCFKECFDLIAASDFYNMADLLSVCCDYIEKQFTADDMSRLDIMMFMSQAVQVDAPRIINVCLACFEENPRTLFLCTEFKTLSLEAIRVILQSEKYFINEVYLIRVMCSWVENTLSQNMANSSTENQLICTYLSTHNLLEHLRLNRISKLTLVDLLNEIKMLFSAEDKLQIMTALVKDSPLPCGLNSDPTQRGGANEDLPRKVIVRTPPMEIIEEFIYNGSPCTLMIDTIELEHRTNSLIEEFAGRYEEELSLACFQQVVTVDGVQDRSERFTVRLVPVTLNLTQNTKFAVHVNLCHAGVYIKNSKFSSDKQGLVRFKQGIVRAFFHENHHAESDGNTNVQA